jgi:hypothetical protein
VIQPVLCDFRWGIEEELGKMPANGEFCGGVVEIFGIFADLLGCLEERWGAEAVRESFIHSAAGSTRAGLTGHGNLYFAVIISVVCKDG